MDFLRMLEGIRTPFGELLFSIITYGGEEIMLLGLICVMYWCVNKKLAYRMTFAYLSSALAVNTIKLACRVPRPWVKDPNFHAVESAKKTATGYSFPSGHTQNSTALFGTLAYVSKNVLLRIVLLLFIPAVMFSRMYLGVHTPADVLVSFCVSALIVTGMNVLADRLEITRKRRLIIMILLLCIAFATMVYTYVLYKTGTIVYADAADSFKGCGGGLGFAIGYFVENEYIKFSPKSRNIGLHLLKFVIGLAGVLILKSGIKYLFNGWFGPHFFTDVFRYFLVMLWAMMIMPLIIKKFFQED